MLHHIGKAPSSFTADLTFAFIIAVGAVLALLSVQSDCVARNPALVSALPEEGYATKPGPEAGAP